MNTPDNGGSSFESRLQSRQSAPAVWAAMMALQQASNRSGLEPALLELVRLRASQINGCAFCIDLHHRVARSAGEAPHRLYLLDAWHEVDSYTPRERAALRWTEALTRLSAGTVSDETFAEVRARFTEVELLELTLAIITINGWNRINVGFRVPPDPSYLPASHSTSAGDRAGADAAATVLSA